MSTASFIHPGSPHQYLVRFGIGLLLAAMVTAGLLWTMQYLIATADRTLDESARGHMVDFVRVKREETIERKKDKPDKPPAPEAPPPEPPAPTLDDADSTVEKIALSPVSVKADVDVSASGFSLKMGDGEYLPIVKVQPVYPRRALARGIEGYVIVEFTVSKRGAVRNVRVVDSEPKTSVFHQAAINAALKFKYKPRIVDGTAVEVPGVQNKITFRLER
jgi:protein TonB